MDIELAPGQSVRVGPCLLRVLAVRSDEVVLALLDPQKDCVFCGERTHGRHQCPVCQTEVLICSNCLTSQSCPRCASPWGPG